jgi:hypothetical protein
VNAVKECAEAIAAISDGKITRVDEREIREAISALITLSRAITDRRAETDGQGDLEIHVNAPPIDFRVAARQVHGRR